MNQHLNLSAEEAAMFDEGELYESELERRHNLERAGRIAADIEIDLQDKGPLYSYVLARREIAARALQDLVDVDPNQAATIAVLQTQVKEFINALSWIGARSAESERAEEAIKEEFGDGAEIESNE